MVEVLEEQEREVRPLEALLSDLRLVIDDLEDQLQKERNRSEQFVQALNERAIVPVVFHACNNCGSVTV